MKLKFTSIILTSLLIGTIILPSQSFADAQKPITVFIEGDQLNFEVPPIIENGTTLVPIRAIFEKLGVKITWDADTQKIIGTKDDLYFQMYIGKTVASINGILTTLEVPPTIINGKTLVPLRFVSEASGNEISWDGTNRRIDVKKSGITNSKLITRAEISRFLVRSLDLYDENALVDFKDVTVDNEFYKDIASGVKYDVISGFGDDLFRPYYVVSRAEYAFIVVDALNIPISNERNIIIKDIDVLDPFEQKYIYAVINAGLMDLYEDGTFRAKTALDLDISKPNIELKEIKAKYNPVETSPTPTPIPTPIPTDEPLPTPTVSNKIDLINQEYLRHSQAIQNLQNNHENFIIFVEDKITSIQRSSIVGYYSEPEYNQKYDSLNTQRQAKQNRLDALSLDTSPEGATQRRKLAKEVADFELQIKNLQDGRSAQIQIQVLEDAEKKENIDYKLKVQEENSLYQSNLANIN